MASLRGEKSAQTDSDQSDEPIAPREVIVVGGRIHQNLALGDTDGDSAHCRPSLGWISASQTMAPSLHSDEVELTMIEPGSLWRLLKRI